MKKAAQFGLPLFISCLRGHSLYIKAENGVATQSKLYNLQGQLLLQTNETEIDFTVYPKGIYILNVNGEQMKIIKN